MWRAARQRAAKRDLPFTIQPSDIIIPDRCPVLDIPLRRGSKRGGDNASPSLDRIVPALGYVPDNIVVVSWKANRAKNNLTAKELRSLAVFYTVNITENPVA